MGLVSPQVVLQSTPREIFYHRKWLFVCFLRLFIFVKASCDTVASEKLARDWYEKRR
nr:MAG TPA: hypothetical protein [Caudoviricetes sp.]